MPTPPIAASQDDVNRRVYHAAAVTQDYQSRSFEPAELTALLRHRDAFVGRDLLDMGAGTGRTTRCLAPLARRYVALDYSPVMVASLRAGFPGVAVQEADVRDLRAFADASFDTVFATNNVLDALSHEARLQALAETRRVLRAGGCFVFSAHNRSHAPAHLGPQRARARSALRTAYETLRWLKRWRNHLRIRHLRRSEPGYALLNDLGHDYACLHYYIDCSTQAAQLHGAGFALVELIDVDGQVVPAVPQATAHAPWLMYVAVARPAV